MHKVWAWPWLSYCCLVTSASFAMKFIQCDQSTLGNILLCWFDLYSIMCARNKNGKFTFETTLVEYFHLFQFFHSFNPSSISPVFSYIFWPEFFTPVFQPKIFTDSSFSYRFFILEFFTAIFRLRTFSLIATIAPIFLLKIFHVSFPTSNFFIDSSHFLCQLFE